jgi:DNA-binding NarL/FixJ family response regulator
MLCRNKPGDRNKANTLASEALSIANELGMKLLADRVRSLTDIKVSKQSRPIDPYHFTSREIEVLKLLAKGMTNREIAQELFVSPDTAATHVRNILNKGNLANRTEAAALAARHFPSQQ